MKAEVIITPNFSRAAKKLIKKYRSLKSELQRLAAELEHTPRKGAKIGEDTYKIRLAVKSKGKGKSGGMRIITYVEVEVITDKEENTTVYLLSIYDKSDYENVPDNILKTLIADLQSKATTEEE